MKTRPTYQHSDLARITMGSKSVSPWRLLQYHHGYLSVSPKIQATITIETKRVPACGLGHYHHENRITTTPGACFRAANVFSFEALFANNPFWIPQPETRFKFSVRKTQPSYGLGYRKCNQIQDGGEDFILLQ